MRCLASLLLLAAAACSDTPTESPEAGPTPDAGRHDTGPITDAAGAPVDAGVDDAGLAEAGPVDTGPRPCEPACADGLQCFDGRCLATCPCEDDGICVPGGFCRPSRCDEDQRCPANSSCLSGRCVRGQSCTETSDCPEAQTCSSAGLCDDAACLVHDDCVAGERCSQGRCVANPHNDPALLFERVRPEAFEDQISPMPTAGSHRAADMWGEWGFGGALLDVDADGDLDLYVTTQATVGAMGEPPCLYRNESLPGSLRFNKQNGSCTYARGAFHTAAGADLDNDGYHELLLGGFKILGLQRFHPHRQYIDLMANVPDDHPGRRCNVSSVVTPDLNFDGRPDLYVACQLDLIDDHGDSYHNLILLQNDQGGFEPLREDAWPYDTPGYLFQEANTLAVGLVDMNSDGLLDVLVLNDSVIKHFDRGSVTPGGMNLRCDPTRTCDFDFRPFGTNSFRHGAYMGAGLARVGDAEWLYVTDFGPNRMVELTQDEEVVDHVTELTAMGSAPDRMLFAWGVAVDDFDRDGRDDFFVTQGAVKSSERREYGEHFDYMLLQGETGSFTVHAEDVGLAPFTTQDAHSEEYVYASRAVLKTDLDADGLIDMVGFGMEGALRLHREVPIAGRQLPPRCTIVPRPRLVPSYGFGVELLPEDGSGARRWNMQGQIRAGTSPWLMSPWSRGQIRFASGASAPFDCQGGPGPVVVEEPDWLALAWNGDELAVTLGAGAPAGAVTVLAEGEAARFETSLEDGAHRVSLPPGTERVMLHIGSRWVARWLTR